MSNQMNHLRSDCENCFGLCCAALPYGKSADFAINKEGGIPCPNLESDYRCRIHSKLRNKGFKGCTSYECFGAGQKVSQDTFEGRDWRDHPKLAKEMFEVFPVMQQLHEMLCYLTEALHLESTLPIHSELRVAQEKTESLTNLEPHLIIGLDVSAHRAVVRFKVKLTQSTGLYHFISSTNHEVILFHFTGEIIGGSLKLEEEEITDSKWVPLCEVCSIEDKELRNPEVIKQIINAVKDNKYYPLEIYKGKLRY